MLGPLAIIHAAWGDFVHKERRQHPRYMALVKTTGRVGDETYPLVCANVGPGGAFFSSRAALVTGSRLRLSLRAPGHNAPFVDLVAEVVWSKPAGGSQAASVAVRWLQAECAAGAEPLRALLRGLLRMQDIGELDRTTTRSASFDFTQQQRIRASLADSSARALAATMRPMVVPITAPQPVVKPEPTPPPVGNSTDHVVPLETAFERRAAARKGAGLQTFSTTRSISGPHEAIRERTPQYTGAPSPPPPTVARAPQPGPHDETNPLPEASLRQTQPPAPRPESAGISIPALTTREPPVGQPRIFAAPPPGTPAPVAPPRPPSGTFTQASAEPASQSRPPVVPDEAPPREPSRPPSGAFSHAPQEPPPRPASGAFALAPREPSQQPQPQHRPASGGFALVPRETAPRPANVVPVSTSMAFEPPFQVRPATPPTPAPLFPPPPPAPASTRAAEIPPPPGFVPATGGKSPFAAPPNTPHPRPAPVLMPPADAARNAGSSSRSSRGDAMGGSQVSSSMGGFAMPHVKPAPVDEQSRSWPTGVPRVLAERYADLVLLGQGGHGVVFRAQDLLLERFVVLKFLAGTGMAPEQARRYFLREFKVAADLLHPNIVRLYDIGSADGTMYYTMEYVPGHPLGHYLGKNGRLDDHKFVFSVFNQLAAALDHAHRHGVLHRDVKPNNVLVADDGSVRLFDFGLARLLADGNKDQSMVVGTPFYMAPEMQRTSPIDSRADQYALGVVLYRMLTGRVPFADGNVFLAHAIAPVPDPRVFHAELPAAVSPIIMKMLAKTPDERYPDCAAAAAELLPVLTGGRTRG